MFLYALNCNATIIILKTSKIAVFLHKNTLYKKNDHFLLKNIFFNRKKMRKKLAFIHHI